MRLKYSILWFEDDESTIDSHQKRFEDFLEGMGFQPELKIVSDGTDLEKLIKEDFNLILLDFNLDSEEENGNTIINCIRDNNVYTEALFYSGKPEFKQHVSSHLDGVFFADRDELYERTIKIINLTIKKNQDINNIRGLVIAETIDLEILIEEMLISYFGIDDEKKQVFMGVVSPNFNAFTLNHKCDLLNKIMKTKVKFLNKSINESKGDKEELETKLENLKSLQSEIVANSSKIIKNRNALAHAREDPDTKNTLIGINKDKDKIPIDDEWCIETRNILKMQLDNLRKLQTYLK